MTIQLTRSTAWLAMANGAVALVSVASLVVFSVVGPPFGAINDWTVGLLGLLSVALALALSRRPHGASTTQSLATLLAVLGGLIAVLGAALVITDTTGFLLAGLVESVGFALVGLWLVACNWSMADKTEWPPRLRSLGIGAGMIMGLGIVVAPGVVMGLDDMATAPGWVWVGFIGWLGIFVLYPAWSLWLGNALRRGSAGSTSRLGPGSAA